MGKSQERACVWVSVLLMMSSACAFALDPSLDISQYAHTAWKVREGFTKGTTFAIEQTPEGYLWLGTESGLARFDGVQAIPWQPPSGEQLPSNFIQDLLVARDGTLWIGTDKGLASWKDGKFTQYPGLAGYRIYSMLQDAGGTIWFAAENPGRVCAVRAGIAQCQGDGSFGFSVSALYQDHKGNLWVSAQTGLWRWAPGPSEHYQLPKGVQADELIEEENGELLMTTNQSGRFEGHVNGSMEGLKQLVGGKIQDYTLPANAGHFTPLRLFRSSDGSLWIGTIQGLLHLYKGRIDRFSVADGLSGDLVTSIFEDREGSVWVSTSTGLDRFRQFAIPTISLDQGLSIAAVDVLQATPDGSIWISTADGLNRWQHGHMTVYGPRNVPKPNGRKDQRTAIDDARVTEVESGLRNKVNSLGQDVLGRLWAESREGVFYFDRGRFVRVPGLPGGDTTSIAGDGHGKVWIGNFDQGLIYSTPEGIVQRIPWTRFGRTYPAVALLSDRLQGGLWLGFVEGGIAYLKDGQIRSYNAADGLGNGAVMDLQYSSDGAVWAATDGGLSRVKDGRITTLTRENGLPCDAVQWAIEDDDHSFWLYTSCGLVRIAHSELDAWVRNSKRAIQTTVFDSSDGLWSFGRNGRHTPYVTKSPDGRIWFSAPDGVSVIDPRHLPFNKLPPPMHIEHVTADGKSYDPSHGLRLPPRIRDLTIRYTALSLVVPEKVQFRFKLEGQDEDWREVVNNREVQYSNLAPGNYRFRVTACNNSGVWNEEGATLDFSIAPAYYQTNWFRALCGLTLLAMLWMVYRLRVGALERRQALLERNQTLLERNQELLERHGSEIRALNEQLIKTQESERMRIAGDLHDGVLQQITSLTLRLGKVRRQVPPESEAKTTVGALQQQLIQIGTDIRHISHELHPAMLQEAGLPAALNSYCEEFSNVRGVPVSCEVDETVKELSPGAALCLYRIAQEALGNAAKHAQAKKIEVRLTRADGRVHLAVSDDGVGCDPKQAGRAGGLGVINMRERVLQLDGRFEFESGPGQGTTVKVEIPFRPAP